MVTQTPRKLRARLRTERENLRVRYARKYHGLFIISVWYAPATEYAHSIGWSGRFDEATSEQCELFNTWMDHRGWAR
jgi:hypothetical protein